MDKVHQVMEATNASAAIAGYLKKNGVIVSAPCDDYAASVGHATEGVAMETVPVVELRDRAIEQKANLFQEFAYGSTQSFLWKRNRNPVN